MVGMIDNNIVKQEQVWVYILVVNPTDKVVVVFDLIITKVYGNLVVINYEDKNIVVEEDSIVYISVEEVFHVVAN